MLQREANCFLLEQTPYQKGAYTSDRVVGLVSISVPLKVNR